MGQALGHMSLPPMAVHIGEEIRKRAKALRWSDTKLAVELAAHRNTVAQYYKDASIDTDVLAKLCTLLDFNFFKLLYEDVESSRPQTSMAAEPQAEYKRQPPQAPLRIVIEADPNNAAAKAEAEQIAQRLLRTARGEGEKKKGK